MMKQNDEAEYSRFIRQHNNRKRGHMKGKKSLPALFFHAVSMRREYTRRAQWRQHIERFSFFHYLLVLSLLGYIVNVGVLAIDAVFTKFPQEKIVSISTDIFVLLLLYWYMRNRQGKRRIVLSTISLGFLFHCCGNLVFFFHLL